FLTAHEHMYERFAPQKCCTASPFNGILDQNGVTEFVIGTGGIDPSSYTSGPALPNEQVIFASTCNSAICQPLGTAFGVVQFTLGPGWYKWKWQPTSGTLAD